MSILVGCGRKERVLHSLGLSAPLLQGALLESVVVLFRLEAYVPPTKFLPTSSPHPRNFLPQAFPKTE